MEKEELIKKKAWLDKLYYEINKQQDFFLSGTYLANGEKLFTKWKKYSECVFPIDFDGSCDDWKAQKFFEQINQRQILPNEVVLDIEDPKQLPNILQQLKKWDWEFKVFETGSRGYHIHLFNSEDFTTDEKEFIITKLGADIQKGSEKNMIALENFPHFKTGRPKTEVENANRDL